MPEFHDKVEHERGITTYTVDDTKEGQMAVRRIIDTHWRKDANPWCLTNSIEGSLDLAWDYWKSYSRTNPSKRIAFKNGKLIAFCASDTGEKQWWDRGNVDFSDIPFTVKSGGKTSTYVFDEDTGKTSLVREQLPDGSYTMYYKNGQKSYELLLSDMTLHMYSNDGKLIRILSLDGLEHEYYKNGKLQRVVKADGTRVKFYENGILMLVRLPDGTFLTFHKNGHLETEELSNGTFRGYYLDGQLGTVCWNDGTKQEYYKSGLLKKRHLANGTIRGYYENQKLKSVTLYNGTKFQCYANGTLETVELNDGRSFSWGRSGTLSAAKMSEHTYLFRDDNGQPKFAGIRLASGKTYYIAQLSQEQLNKLNKDTQKLVYKAERLKQVIDQYVQNIIWDMSRIRMIGIDHTSDKEADYFRRTKEAELSKTDASHPIIDEQGVRRMGTGSGSQNVQILELEEFISQYQLDEDEYIDEDEKSTAKSLTETLTGLYNFVKYNRSTNSYDELEGVIERAIDVTVKDLQEDIKSRERFLKNEKDKRFIDLLEQEIRKLQDNISFIRDNIDLSSFIALQEDETENLDAYHQIIGEQGTKRLDDAEGNTWRMDNLKIAKQMAEAGKDAKTIRLATGWEFDTSDKKWKYEIADGDLIPNAKFKNFEKRYPTEYDLKIAKMYRLDLPEYYSWWEGKLADIFDAPELYKAYPELKDFKVVPALNMENTVGGVRPGTQTISLDRGYVDEDGNVILHDEGEDIPLREVLLHEIQHVIQGIEGFAKGKNPKDFEAEYNNTKEQRTKSKAELEAKIAEIETISGYTDFANSLNIDNMSDKEVADAVNDFWANSPYKQEYEKLNAFWRKLEFDTPSTKYLRVPGEREARNVQARKNYTNEQRRSTLFSESIDHLGFVPDENGRPFEYNEDYYQIIGVKGAMKLDQLEHSPIRMRDLVTAIKMTKAGKNAKTIRLATGWELAPDGKWRFELQDEYVDLVELANNFDKRLKKAKNEYDIFLKKYDKLSKRIDFILGEDEYREEFIKLCKEKDKLSERLNELSKEITITLVDVLGTSNEIIRAYPELADIQIKFEPTGKQRDGYYDSVNEVIVINDKYVKNNDNYRLREILTHEVQHAIQEIEGFTEGYPPDPFEPLDREYFNLNDKLLNLDFEANIWNEIQDIEEEFEYGLILQDDRERKKAELRYSTPYAEEYRKILARIDKLNAFSKKYFNGHTDADDIYMDMGGEVEARNASKRMDFTPEQRRETLLRDTQDTDRWLDPAKVVPIMQSFSHETYHQIIGKDGAIALDKSEGVTTRMDALKQAEDMDANDMPVFAIWRNTGWMRGADGEWRMEIPDGQLKEALTGSSKLRTLTLSEAYDNPYLFKAYPVLKDMPVRVQDLSDSAAGYYDLNSNSIAINQSYLQKRDFSNVRSTLIHEIQHAVQHLEGFDNGSTGGTMNTWLDAIHNTIRYTFDKDTREKLIDAYTALREGDSLRVASIRASMSKDELSRWNEITSAYNNYLKGLDEHAHITGEVEARNAETRADMSEQERHSKPLTTTEGYKRSEQIRSKIKDNSERYNQPFLRAKRIEDKFMDIEEFTLTPEDKKQIEQVRSKYYSTDQWMKAPNGKDSNLTEQQWLAVRTPNFMHWFGDWINDPKNASRVLDKNGEPLVVYHGTPKDRMFSIFHTRHQGEDAYKGTHQGAHFGTLKSSIDRIIDLYRSTYNLQHYIPSNPEELARKHGHIMPCFLNIRKLGRVKDQGFDWSKVINVAKSKGFDGLIYENEWEDDGSNSYIVLEPEQIKSATRNNGEYSSNPDVYKQIIGMKGAERLDKLQAGNRGLTGNIDSLAQAKKLEELGVSNFSIWGNTGWTRGADNKWRTEILDGEIRKDVLLNNPEQTTFKLSDIYNNDALYNAYPELQNMPVLIKKISDDTFGLYDSVDKNIVINRSKLKTALQARYYDFITSSLIHEIQHAVQDIEEFDKGSGLDLAGRHALKNFNRIMTIQSPNIQNKMRYAANALYIDKDKSRFDALLASMTEQERDVWDKLAEYYNRLEAAYDRYRRSTGEVEARNAQFRAKWDSPHRRSSILTGSEDTPRHKQIRR